MQENKKLSLIVAVSSAVLVLLLSLMSFLVLRGNRKTLFISEICGSNAYVPNEDGYMLDYVEVTNASEKEQDLSGFHLSDGTVSGAFTFPEGTILQSGESLVVWCGMDAPFYSRLLYAPFGIAAGGGETIVLSNRHNRILDQCETVRFSSHSAMVRMEDDSWEMSDGLTPGFSNDLAYAQGTVSNHKSDLSPICISEILSSNTLYMDPSGKYPDFVEIHNTGDELFDISGYSLSDNASRNGFVFPENTVIDADGYLILWLGNGSDNNQNGFYGAFSLSRDGEDILLLRNEEGCVVDFTRVVPLKDNESMCLIGNSWLLSSYATPGFANSEGGYDEWLASMNYVADALVISEFMASNKTVLADPTGEFPDWIEIANRSDTPVHLSGWFLSDDEDDITKYALPAIELGAGEEMIFFCGEGNEGNGVYYTGFNLSSYGETIVLTGPGGIQADLVSYGTAATDRSFQRDPNSGEFKETIYATPGFPNMQEGYEAFCCTFLPKGELAIWEVMTTNDWYLPDENGKCYDLVEVKNVSQKAIDLSGYSMTDSTSDPKQYVFPEMTLEAGDSLVVLMSGDVMLSGKYLHGSFSLSGAEESLYLYKGDDLIDYTLLFDIPNKGSFGRYETGAGFYFMTPTPGGANAEGKRRISEEPSSDLPAGCYETEDPLYLTLSGNGGEIYYTLDGSVPTEDSLHFESPLEITSTCVVRAVQIEEGCMVSDVLTLNYLINEGDEIPVLCLVTDPANLWGAKGIYRPSWLIKEIEVAGNVAYYGDDGEFSIDCGISMHGMTTLLVSEKKSFTLRFRNNYDGPLEFPFFEDQDYETYYSLMLRADVEGTYPTMMRDTMWGEICNRYSDHVMGLDHKYCAIYLNGEFWGIYTVREHFSTEYYSSRMNVPVENCRMVKSFYEYGDPLYNLNEWLKDHPLTIEENWEYVRTVIDVESFAEWMIFQAYTGNTDVNGNMRYFYCEEEGLWRCAISDVDLGMFGYETFKVPLYALQHGSICRYLIENSDFQHMLIEKLSYFLHGPLSEDNMIALIDELQAELAPEFQKETDRWGCPVHTWESLVEDLRMFCRGRSEIMIWGLRDYIPISSEDMEFYFGDILHPNS